MGLSQPRSIFGIHSVSPYNVDTGEFYGILKVLETSNLTLTGELIDLLGGSNKYPWDSQEGSITAEMALAFSEYPDFVFELFLGKAPTNNAAEASGNVSTITNKNGTTVVNASTGIASIAAKSGDEADLKFGRYVIKATGAATVDLYYSSDADIGRGTNGEYQDDLLKVNSASITVPGSSATVDVADFGLEITGGSGVIAFTTGDTATFEVRPINTDSSTVRIGSIADQTFPEFGAVIMAAKKSNQQMFEIDAFKCKAAGMPINFSRNAYSAAEVTVKMLYDSAKDGLFDMRWVDAS